MNLRMHQVTLSEIVQLAHDFNVGVDVDQTWSDVSSVTLLDPDGTVKYLHFSGFRALLLTMMLAAQGVHINNANLTPNGAEQ